MRNMKNNKNFIWLITEYKRAASWLPLFLKRQLILAVMCIIMAGMFIFCGKVFSSEQKEEKIKIGYVAQENTLTRLAVGYVSEMESVKSLCKLKKVLFEEGMHRLENGELSALIVLPDNVIDEILSGSNTPATLYLHKSSDIDITGLESSMQVITTKIFKELAAAGIGMLQTAQAEIYAVSELMSDGVDMQRLYDDINEFNIRAVMGRDNFFEDIKLSLTDNNTVTVYYAGAIFAIYILLSGVFFGGYCKRSKMEQLLAFKRLEISYFVQIISRVIVIMPFMALTIFIPLLIIELPFFSNVLECKYTINGIIAVFFITLFISSYTQLLYQLSGKRTIAPLLFGILALFQGYMSGCIIPSVLLPKIIADIGMYLPSAYIKAGMTMLFTGNVKNTGQIIIGFLLWSIIAFLLTWLLAVTSQNKISFNKINLKIRVSFGNSLFSILLKRMLYQKSFWGCMLLTVCVSFAIKGIENESPTAIYAAVYNENSAAEDIINKELLSYDGLIRFKLYDSKEAVKKAVLKGEAECGYVLSEHMIQDIINARDISPIISYEDGDSIATQVVDEVLFNIVFKEASLQWFEEYISDKTMAGDKLKAQIGIRTREAFERQILDNKTFDMDIEYIGKNTENNVDISEENTAFPVELVICFSVILCGVQGVLQAVSDFKKNRFYKRNRFWVVMITIIQPMVIGGIVGGICLYLIG